MNIFCNAYKDSDPLRQEELDHALHMNLLSPYIKSCIVLTDGTIELPVNPKLQNAHILRRGKRPFFQDFFRVANELEDNEVNILLNSDIHVDDTIRLAENIGENEVYCLSKWESDTGKHIETTGDSADTWIWRGKMRLSGMYFNQGKLGSDNRLAWELQNAGYKVSNPSKTIKTWHVHSSGVRHYSRNNPKDYVEPPYLTVPVTEL